MAGIHTDYHRWRKVRALVLSRDDYTCYMCGKHANAVDHVVPRSMGMDELHFNPDNLRAICTPCNSHKGGSKRFLCNHPTPMPPHVVSLPNTQKMNPQTPFTT